MIRRTRGKLYSVECSILQHEKEQGKGKISPNNSADIP
jgi:hypothetical protein